MCEQTDILSREEKSLLEKDGGNLSFVDKVIM